MELLRGVSAANNFVLALVPPLSSQLSNSRSRPGDGGVNAARMQKTDHRHRRLLRALRERPRRRCAAEQRDERAPPHSITSSASASSAEGTARPSALAVLRLITNSNLVGCSTGRSAGLAPLRMRLHSSSGRPLRQLAHRIGCRNSVGRSENGELDTSEIEQDIGSDEEGVDPVGASAAKLASISPALLALKVLQPACACGRLHILRREFGTGRIGRIDEQANVGGGGNEFAQEPKPLCCQLGRPCKKSDGRGRDLASPARSL
jgi:hypothetical protein